jgi:hypothetical protein
MAKYLCTFVPYLPYKSLTGQPRRRAFKRRRVSNIQMNGLRETSIVYNFAKLGNTKVECSG